MTGLLLFLACTAAAATTSNDDSCDIGVVPAATLLLPYFEVDLEDPNGEQTIFTITNVTKLDRIARVTLWTDYAFPVVTFNVPLTGYDVQSISLYDVLVRGAIGTGKSLPPEALPHMRSAFTDGKVPACKEVGRKHENAVGYATVDLVSNSSSNIPLSEEYWTEDIAFDNVLIGDYQQIDSGNDFAQGGPMVHIRAIPEGGTPTERIAYHKAKGPHFPRTFYGRLQPWFDPLLDSRQPLPAVFAVRWIAGGRNDFATRIKIWREGTTGPRAPCGTHDDNVTAFPELTTFDEAENAISEVPRCRCTVVYQDTYLPATSLTDIRDASVFPQLSNGATGGWLYLNLDNADGDATASSNWVIASVRSEGRYSADVDVASLGNGCSAPAPVSEIFIGYGVIGPRP